MKYCNACNVSIDNPISHCPLCYTNLTSIDSVPELPSYPHLSQEKKVYNLLMKILFFISVSLIAISITVNMLTPIDFPWSLIVIICILYVWIALGTAIRKHKRIGLNLLTQLVSGGLLLMFLGTMLGFKASVYNYVFPALVASAMLSFNILSIVRRKELTQLLIYYLIVSAIGFVPLILFWTGLVTVSWPAISCAVYCGLSIISIFVFAFRATRNELSKRLHL